jgi:tRNA G18 (ribose-2'-O)-methylase SpoU
MNVIDSLKDLSIPEIGEYCYKNSIPASVAMINIGGDFNLSTMVRNANFFGFRSVHYVGKKKWDKRGSVGTHHYTSMYYHKTEEDFIKSHSSSGRTLIAIENNIPEYKDITFDPFSFDFSNIDEPIFIFGEENAGLSETVLMACSCVLTIPTYGSVRSLNVGTTSGIIMSIYRHYYEKYLKG